MEFNTYNAENNSELRKLQMTILDIINIFMKNMGINLSLFGTMMIRGYLILCRVM